MGHTPYFKLTGQLQIKRVAFDNQRETFIMIKMQSKFTWNFSWNLAYDEYPKGWLRCLSVIHFLATCLQGCFCTHSLSHQSASGLVATPIMAQFSSEAREYISTAIQTAVINWTDYIHYSAIRRGTVWRSRWLPTKRNQVSVSDPEEETEEE